MTLALLILRTGACDSKDETNQKMMRKKRQNAMMKLSPVGMEEGVNDRKYEKYEKNDEGKEA